MISDQPADGAAPAAPPSPSRGAGRGETLRLGLLFGAVYFIQGIGAPGEGLVAQPVSSMLKSWGHTAGEVAVFWGLLGLPWSIKPLYGLLSDFVPIFGSRRRGYLILTTLATSAGFGCLYLVPPVSGQGGYFLLLMLASTVGVAFSDVVIDALMVERGQPLGMTGRLQSIQWAAMYGAMILTGSLGGLLIEHGRNELAFLICAAASSVSLVLAIVLVREPPRGGAGASRRARGGEVLPGENTRREADGPGEVTAFSRAPRVLWRTLRSPPVMAAAGFLFLWNFNPFSFSVLYMFATEEVGLSEQFYGNLMSLFSFAAVVASISYGFFCRRVPLRWLIHVAIAAGVLTTLAYTGLSGSRSAVAVTLVAGFAYMTGSLIQLDLAARVCPPHVAGTVFALLMALSNLGILLSEALGGAAFDAIAETWGSRAAFNALVGLGALCTSACWLMVPYLNRSVGEEGGESGALPR